MNQQRTYEELTRWSPQFRARLMNASPKLTRRLERQARERKEKRP
jgi:predicted RecB family nuclease